MRANLDDNLARRLRHSSALYNTLEATLTGTFRLSKEGPQHYYLNPNGATRTVFLPPIEPGGGQFYLIANTGIAGNLTVVDFGGVTQFSLIPGAIAFFVSSKTKWYPCTVNGMTDAPTDGKVYGRQNGAWVVVREQLTANRGFFVRTPPVAVTVPVASPGVVNWNNHSLSPGDPVYFSNIRNQAQVTTSIATPCVVNWTNHGLSGGQPIKLQTTGALPGGILKSATVTIDIPTSTITWNSHGLVTNSRVNITTTGALPTGMAAGQTYYVINPTANTFQLALFPNGVTVISLSGTQSGVHTAASSDFVFWVSTVVDANNFRISATAGGADINTTGSQSGIHFAERASILPVGLVEGTAYFVAGDGSLTTNSFRLWTTAAGPTLVNFGSFTAGLIYAATGNDSNNGLASTRTGAFATIGKAVLEASSLDLKTFTVTINVAQGTYNEPVAGRPYVGQGPITIQSTGGKENTSIALSGNGTPIGNNFPPKWAFNGFRLAPAAPGFPCAAFSAAGQADLLNIDFGPANAAHLSIVAAAIVNINSGYMISGGAGNHMSMNTNCSMACGGRTVTILGKPHFGTYFIAQGGGTILYNANTFVPVVTTPAATGVSANCVTNAVIDCQLGTNTAAANYLPGDHTFSEAAGGVII